MKKHLIIPDTQVKPGIKLDHFTWIGKYAVDKRPDVIVHLGDWYDLPSLCSYDKKERPGDYYPRSYERDLAAGDKSVDMLEDELRRARGYRPRKVYIVGNHEQRFARLLAEQPNLRGALRPPWAHAAARGWEVIPFLRPIRIGGILYAHYFDGGRGKAYGGDARYKLGKIHASFTCGHSPGLSSCIVSLPRGRRLRGLVAGSCYLHAEEYPGPQGNREWSGIIMKHEVDGGDYNLMEVSLNYLRRRYGK